FNVALMACWGALYLECRKHIENPNIVTRDGQIRYRHPCDEKIIRANCRKPNERQWEGFFAHYEKTGKTSLSLTSKIMNGDDIAAYFEGVFVLLSD
ncbi:MAG: YiiD C-terminal domain-containing protein, partial [Pseudomonadales bacterium]